MTNNPTWCPVCDEGWVKEARVEPLGLHGQCCAECEAWWHTGEAVGDANFIQLSALLRLHGTTLERVKLVWSSD